MTSLSRYLEVTLCSLVVVSLYFIVYFSLLAGVSIHTLAWSPATLLGAGFLGYVGLKAWRIRLAPQPVSQASRAARALEMVRLKFEYVLCFVIVALGSVYCFLTPPLQVSDEAAHFYRAYEVSELNFSATGLVPRNVAISGVSLVGALPGRANERASLSAILGSYSLPLTRHDLYQLTNGHHTARHYPPISYLGSSLGIALGKALSCPPVVLIYLGRLFNLVLFSALVFLTYRLLPFGKALLACLALLPMMLSLAASLSVDAVTAMLCFLCVAWLLRLAADKQKITYVRGTCIVLIICLAILAKNGAYIAFSGLIFVLPSSAFGSKKGQVLFFAVTSVLAVGLVLLWQRYMLFDSVYGRMAAESGTQRILERPWEYVNWIFETLTHEKGYLWDTFVGRLGWNDTLLPAWIRYSALVLFTLVSVFINFERVYPSPWQRTVLIGVALSNVLLIYYAFFSLNILGIQGRYFIPLGLCLLLPLTLKRFNIMERLSADGARSLHRGTLMAMIAYFVVVHCATYQTLLMRFWSN